MPRFRTFLVLLLLAACGRGDPVDLLDDGPLRFAWPAPGAVQVTEKVLKGGGEAELRYVLDIIPDGDSLILRYRDFEFLRIAGSDLDDPEVRRSLQPVMALARATPDMKLTRAGRLVDVVEFDRAMERAVATLQETAPDDEATLRALRQTLTDPRTAAALRQNAVLFWGTWVEMWLEYPDLAANQEVEFEQSVPALDGSLVGGTGRCRHHGPAEEAAGHVRLSAVIEAEREELRAAVVRFMTDLIAQTDPEQASDISPGDLEEVGMVMRVEVVTRPNTLQPRWARFEKVVTAKASGVPPIENVERHEYTFDWNAP